MEFNTICGQLTPNVLAIALTIRKKGLDVWMSRTTVYNATDTTKQTHLVLVQLANKVFMYKRGAPGDFLWANGVFV